MKNWKLLHEIIDKNTVQNLAPDEIVSILLKNRGLTSKKEINDFLHPKLEDITLETCELDVQQMEKAVKRILEAVKKNETIIVYGDYDVDGICGTAILWETLFQFTKNVHPYIPGRFDEGYGLSIRGIENVLEKFPPHSPIESRTSSNPLPKGEGKIGLIITVDNGIVAYEPTDFATKKGIDVITTDHHVIGSENLNNFATVHTTKLCGTGVAYMLSKEILSCHSRENGNPGVQESLDKNSKDPESSSGRHDDGVIPAKAGIQEVSKGSELSSSVSLSPQSSLKERGGVSADNDHLSLVALATIADLVPLIGPNRTFVKFGIEKLRQTMRPGLLSLFSLAGIQKEKIGTYEIGYMIGPRLNAAGRLFSALDSLRLICTKNLGKAQELAANLEATNRERQAITQEAVSHARLNLLTKNNSRILFVHHDEYNEGIIGLVASRLVEEHYKPAFVISRGETHSKGSARSISGVNIIEMIRSVSDNIVQAGGHPMAAGFTVETSQLAALQAALEKRAEELVLDEFLTRTLTIDMPLAFCSINADLHKKIQTLAPFGMKNSEPTFLAEKVVIEDMKKLGKEGKHLRLELSQPDLGVHSCVAFGMGDRAEEFAIGDEIDIVFTVDLNTWNGRTSLQLKIKDIKKEN